MTQKLVRKAPSLGGDAQRTALKIAFTCKTAPSKTFWKELCETKAVFFSIWQWPMRRATDDTCWWNCLRRFLAMPTVVEHSVWIPCVGVHYCLVSDF